MVDSVTMQKVKKIAVPASAVSMKTVWNSAVLLGTNGAYQLDLRTNKEVRNFTRVLIHEVGNVKITC